MNNPGIGNHDNTSAPGRKIERLQTRTEEANDRIYALVKERDEARAERDAAVARAVRAEQERDEARLERDTRRRLHQETIAERDAALAQVAAVRAALDRYDAGDADWARVFDDIRAAVDLAGASE